FLPESPRWLIAQEKYSEAAVVLTRIAETNSKNIDPVELRLKIKKLGERIKKEDKMDEVKNTATDLVRYPNLRKKFLIVTFCWVADMFAYYGLQINVPNLGGNPFINFFILSAVEIPGLICSWYFMEKYGRRWTSVSFLILTGSSCLLVAIVPEGIPYVAIVCSLIGKFGASAAFMAVYQQSSELYPTTVRSIGMGMSGTFAGVANIVIPYVVFLAVIAKYIPFVIIGLVNLLAGISAILLPETLNAILPQTIQDAERFGRDQKCFSCNPRRTSIESLNEEQSPKLLNDEI
ncbi:organic cation transporter protein, partial [Caerostris extrusa]